jgi:hypothetical protein
MRVSSLRVPRLGQGWAVDGLQSRRSVGHLVHVAGLAAGRGVLREPEFARERLDVYYRTAGLA